jgi:Cu2+-exporting ATPase
MFRDKFWVTFALTIPVVVWSTDVQHWLGHTAPSFAGSKFIPAILGTVVFVYGGLVFIRGAWAELAGRKPGMMTLISLAIMVAFGTSLARTLGLFEIEVREAGGLSDPGSGRRIKPQQEKGVDCTVAQPGSPLLRGVGTGG